QGCRGGDLKKRTVRHVQILGERCAPKVSERCTGRSVLPLHRLPESVRNRTVSLGHVCLSCLSCSYQSTPVEHVGCVHTSPARLALSHGAGRSLLRLAPRAPSAAARAAGERWRRAAAQRGGSRPTAAAS